MLSRGAVVAREYGLLAVAGIAGATQLLPDGQVVLLDGLSGTVTVINQMVGGLSLAHRHPSASPVKVHVVVKEH